MKSFETLAISVDMQKNLHNLNYIEMTPIQEKSIPIILEGHDIMAQAKTGSGKTAAFGIGLLEKLRVDYFRIQGIVLCPTRELAEQVTGELRRLARFKHNIKLLTLTGGMPMYKQEHSLSHKAHIVVGTPGRILKLLERGSLILDDISMCILDEADRMLDMGFIDQIKEIIGYTPREIQTLCYSATFPEPIKKFCSTFLNKPKDVKVESNHEPKVIKQHFFTCQKRNKVEKVSLLLKNYKPESTIVFCNTKDNCRRVAAQLKRDGIPSLSLHGDLEQKERTDVLIMFSNGSSRVLVATDVAARGLDIDGLEMVINYDLPFETETYIHRIGRTGRAGSDGIALSMSVIGEEFRLKEINSYLKSDFAFEDIDLIENIDTTLPKPEMVTLSINGGRKNKISPGDLLGALTVKGGLTGKDIGKIDRLDFVTFVAVKREVAAKGFEMLDQGQIKGRSFRAKMHN